MRELLDWKQTRYVQVYACAPNQSRTKQNAYAKVVNSRICAEHEKSIETCRYFMGPETAAEIAFLRVRIMEASYPLLLITFQS